MAKYLIDSTDIEIEEVSGTENLKFNLASRKFRTNDRRFI